MVGGSEDVCLFAFRVVTFLLVEKASDWLELGRTESPPQRRICRHVGIASLLFADFFSLALSFFPFV